MHARTAFTSQTCRIYGSFFVLYSGPQHRHQHQHQRGYLWGFPSLLPCPFFRLHNQRLHTRVKSMTLPTCQTPQVVPMTLSDMSTAVACRYPSPQDAKRGCSLESPKSMFLHNGGLMSSFKIRAVYAIRAAYAEHRRPNNTKTVFEYRLLGNLYVNIQVCFVHWLHAINVFFFLSRSRIRHVCHIPAITITDVSGQV